MDNFTIDELKLLLEALGTANVQVAKAKGAVALFEKIEAMINSVDTEKKDS